MLAYFIAANGEAKIISVPIRIGKIERKEHVPAKFPAMQKALYFSDHWTREKSRLVHANLMLRFAVIIIHDPIVSRPKRILIAVFGKS